MRLFFFLFCGIFTGLYLSWPGLVIPQNWKCFNEIIAKSSENKISLKHFQFSGISKPGHDR